MQVGTRLNQQADGGQAQGNMTVDERPEKDLQKNVRIIPCTTLHTWAGEVELKVPRLRNAPFETAIIERYRGMRVSAGTVSELNQKMYQRVEAWRDRFYTGQMIGPDHLRLTARNWVLGGI